MKHEDKPSKFCNSALFFSNWLFIGFLVKHFYTHSNSTGAYLAGNISNFLAALIITAAMIHYFPKGIVVIAIPIMLTSAVLLAIS